MGIDYSDIINGIIIFLLIGLSLTFFTAILILLGRNKHLEKKIKLDSPK